MAPRPLHPAMAPCCHVQSAKVVRRPPPLLEVRTPIALAIWGIKCLLFEIQGAVSSDAFNKLRALILTDAPQGHTPRRWVWAIHNSLKSSVLVALAINFRRLSCLLGPIRSVGQWSDQNLLADFLGLFELLRKMTMVGRTITTFGLSDSVAHQISTKPDCRNTHRELPAVLVPTVLTNQKARIMAGVGVFLSLVPEMRSLTNLPCCQRWVAHVCALCAFEDVELRATLGLPVAFRRSAEGRPLQTDFAVKPTSAGTLMQNAKFYFAHHIICAGFFKISCVFVKGMHQFVTLVGK